MFKVKIFNGKIFYKKIINNHNHYKSFILNYKMRFHKYKKVQKERIIIKGDNHWKIKKINKILIFQKKASIIQFVN